jgi:DNA-binding winged helix-turn-helix (wHTH) protein/TolB-like protein
VRSHFRFGRFELRPQQRALLSDGKPLRLGGRAFDILLSLIERRDRIVDCDELLDLVWPGLAVEENNLSVQISTLRRLLGPDAIVTIRGRGYRFTASIREVPVDGDDAAEIASRCLRQPEGAIAAFAGQRADHFFDALWLGAAVRVIHETDHAVCIEFDRVQDAIRVVLKVQRDAQPGVDAYGGPHISTVRIGMVRCSLGDATAATGSREQAALAHALALSAAAHDIVVSADLVSEFVQAVDGDVEDLGDLILDGAAVRAYRVRVCARSMLDDGGSRAAEDGARPSIAVLPLDSVDGGNDVLVDALADEIIMGISRIHEFSVVSGLSSRRLYRCGLSTSAASACLSASYLLTGSCRSSADGIVLTLHLQDARQGNVLRSLRIETSLREAFGAEQALGSRVAEDVSQTVFHHALQASKSRPLPELPNYALLMGSVGLMHRATLREFERARAMLEHLIHRPGCNTVAAAWLAKWHVLRVVQGWSPDSSSDAQLALDYVARSLDDDSRDALALSIGGLVHAYLRKDLATAGQLYEQAIDANPSEPLAWLFSATRLAYLGRGKDAELSGDQALRLSPIDPLKYFFDSLVATAALANANWERSIALSHRSLKANRTHASTWRTLAIAMVMSNRMDEARSAVQRLLAIEPGLTLGRFRERFPGRDGPLAEPFAEALKAAGLPD